MKTILQGCIAAFGICVMLSATAQEKTMPAFAAVDKDMDEFLSIEEARAVFGTLTLTDSDGNGYLDKREAEDALPDLAWTDDTHEDSEERIGSFEYTLMAEHYMQAQKQAEEDVANPDA